MEVPINNVNGKFGTVLTLFLLTVYGMLKSPTLTVYSTGNRNKNPPEKKSHEAKPGKNPNPRKKIPSNLNCLIFTHH